MIYRNDGFWRLNREGYFEFVPRRRSWLPTAFECITAIAFVAGFFILFFMAV